VFTRCRHFPNFDISCELNSGLCLKHYNLNSQYKFVYSIGNFYGAMIMINGISLLHSTALDQILQQKKVSPNFGPFLPLSPKILAKLYET